MITIYGLTDEHGGIRYIGQTGTPRQRFTAHKSEKHCFKPEGMAVLERVTTRKKANDAEHKWITFFGKDNLTNRAPRGRMSPTTKNQVVAVCYMPKSLVIKIREITEETGDSLSQFIRSAVIKYLNNRKRVSA